MARAMKYGSARKKTDGKPPRGNVVEEVYRRAAPAAPSPENAGALLVVYPNIKKDINLR